jgi:hypothetical protein
MKLAQSINRTLQVKWLSYPEILPTNMYQIQEGCIQDYPL